MIDVTTTYGQRWDGMEMHATSPQCALCKYVAIVHLGFHGSTMTLYWSSHVGYRLHLGELIVQKKHLKCKDENKHQFRNFMVASPRAFVKSRAKA